MDVIFVIEVSKDGLCDILWGRFFVRTFGSSKDYFDEVVVVTEFKEFFVLVSIYCFIGFGKGFKVFLDFFSNKGF